MEIESSLDRVERRIVTAMIVSKQFMDETIAIFKPEYLISDEARTIARWCSEYYKQYNDAPGKHITDIMAAKKRDGTDKTSVEMLELMIDSLNEDYEPGQLNIPFVLDETDKYFRKRNLLLLSETIEEMARSGDVLEAEKALTEHELVARSGAGAVSITSPDEAVVKAAFTETKESLIQFPGALGRFTNYEMIREGFVALMGPEKVGKTFRLIDLAIRGLRSGSNVVFFDAGDMGMNRMIRRIGIHQSGRSDDLRFCGEMLIPVLDCYNNQCGNCEASYCVGSGSIFEDEGIGVIRDKGISELRELYFHNLDYVPCHECSKREKQFPGVIWYRNREAVDPLTWKEAHESLVKLGSSTKRNLK